MADIPTKKNIPGVYLDVRDLSLVISPVAAINVAAVIKSNIGFVDEIIDLGSEADLVNSFGTPNANNFEEWYNIRRIWLYRVGGIGANVKTVRPVGTGSLNGGLSVSENIAMPESTPQLIRNRSEAVTFSPTFDQEVASVVDEVVGTGDGSTTVFTLDNTGVVTDSEDVYVDGNLQSKNAELYAADYSIDYVTGTITFTVPPDIEALVTASYNHVAAASMLKFFSAYPTDVAYQVALANATDFSTANITTGVTFASNFDQVPTGTEVAIAVLDSSGNILEKWIVDMTSGNVDGYGLDTYIENVLNQKSSYIFAFINDVATVAPASFEATYLAGGVYVQPTAGDIQNAFELFNNTKAVDVNYILSHPDAYAKAITVASNRQDCAWRAGIPFSQVVNVDKSTALSNVQTYTGTTLATTSTFGSMASNAAMIFDTYNNKYRWINLAGDMIGLRVQQNLSKQPWWADAFLNYGVLKEVVKLAQDWDDNDIKSLIEAKTNPVINEPGTGFVKWNQQNYTSVNSALRDENVRELVNYIWRAGRVYLKLKLGEFNDEFTRGAVESQFKRFLSNVQDGRGIRRKTDGADGYRVRCDGTNNTDDVINQNIMVVDIAFLPARVITEVTLRMSILENSVQLELF